jgi:hypothetical protein
MKHIMAENRGIHTHKCIHTLNVDEGADRHVYTQVYQHRCSCIQGVIESGHDLMCFSVFIKCVPGGGLK